MNRYLTWICLTVLLIVSASSPGPVRSSPPSPIQVTTTGGRRPTLSPDGMQMAYQSDLGLVIMTLASNDTSIITHESALEPDWSRDNDLLLYRGGNPYGLWVYEPSTHHHAFLTDVGFDDGAFWAAGGNEIIAQTSTGPYGDGLVVISYPDGDPTYLSCLEPDQSSCSGEDPTGSPDNQWIAFSDGSLQKVSRNGGSSVEITTVQQGSGHPSWSPDGQWIAFVTYEFSEFDTFAHIWVTAATGSNFGLLQLTEGDYSDDYPAWSPDSHEIYFTSNRSGSEEIWKVAFDAGLVPVAKQTWGQLKAHRW
jgi:Tol biopolymer transport system component